MAAAPSDLAMANKCFGVGDEVALHGVVRLVDTAGDGTVTIERHRVTIMADSSYVDLMGEVKRESFTKAPKAGRSALYPAKP